jgi:hypothetical protein
MYNVILAPYANAPTMSAAPICQEVADRGASATPIARLTLPAAAPFQKVLTAGVIPSISAVK